MANNKRKVCQIMTNEKNKRRFLKNYESQMAKDGTPRYYTNEEPEENKKKGGYNYQSLLVLILVGLIIFGLPSLIAGYQLGQSDMKDRMVQKVAQTEQVAQEKEQVAEKKQQDAADKDARNSILLATLAQQDEEIFKLKQYQFIAEAQNNEAIVIYFNAKDSLLYAQKIFKDNGFNTKIFEQDEVATYVEKLQSTATSNTTTKKSAADIKSARFALVVSSGDLTYVELNQNIKECLLVE